MILLQRVSLVCILGCTSLAFAADTFKSLIPENVIVCAPGSGCTNQTRFGRNYKVLSTSRFTVMISVSTQGSYTRADVSIANKGSYPLNLSPQDFRVEVLTPKPRVLLYVAPADLKDLPPLAPPVKIRAKAIRVPEPEVKLVTVSETTSSTGEPNSAEPNINELDLAAKQRAIAQEAAELLAAQKDLPTASLSPNEITRGRVFFERDKRAKSVTVVLPIAGSVFEFPFVLER